MDYSPPFCHLYPKSKLKLIFEKRNGFHGERPSTAFRITTRLYTHWFSASFSHWLSNCQSMPWHRHGTQIACIQPVWTGIYRYYCHQVGFLTITSTANIKATPVYVTLGARGASLLRLEGGALLSDLDGRASVGKPQGVFCRLKSPTLISCNCR